MRLSTLVGAFALAFIADRVLVRRRPCSSGELVALAVAAAICELAAELDA